VSQRYDFGVLLGVLHQQLVDAGLITRDLRVDRLAAGPPDSPNVGSSPSICRCSSGTPLRHLSRAPSHRLERRHRRFEALVVVAFGTGHQADIGLLEFGEP
jgi:hypothetical protein